MRLVRWREWPAVHGLEGRQARIAQSPNPGVDPGGCAISVGLPFTSSRQEAI
jgi:hypothetical protein